MSHKETEPSVELASRRLVIIRLMTGGLLVLAVLSQARVHLIERGKIIDRARESKRFIVEKKEPAIRGAIYSSDGKALSQADDRRLLVVDFRKVPHSSGFFMALGAASGISPSEFADRAASGQKVVEWNRTFTAAQSEAIQDVKRKWRADGVGTRVSPNRAYGLGEAASSLVGIYRGDGAKLGVEQAYDDRLKGTDGRIIGMVDKEGQYLPMRVDRSTKRKTDGKPITLTIDSELQHVAYESIKSAVKARNARQGAVVMMDPANGNILALASYPSFDPTKPFRETKPGELPDGFATAFQASLEPGSTFKIATVAKALDEGLLQPDEIVNCSGSINVGSKTIHCAMHGGSRAHGMVNPEQAIARSCNVAAAIWALKVGNEKFNNFIEGLGLLERRPTGLPGEPRPQYDKNAPAPKLHLANVGFGQSINVTPVSLASAFCAIANGGTAVKPRLVDRIGEEVQPIKKGERVLQPETCETVLNYMRSVISSDRGTGNSLRIAGYDLGGKTGTAQKTNKATRSMKGGGYVANFVGFVPAANPRAVILVMVDDPQGAEYYGAQVAGPVFLEVARESIKRLSIPKGIQKTQFARVDKPKDGKRVGPTLTVKSRLIGDRDESMVIGRNDRPVAKKVDHDIVDKPRVVVQREGDERTDPRLKLRREIEDPATKSSTKTAKAPTKKSEPKRDDSKNLAGVSTSGASPITIRRDSQDSSSAKKKASAKTTVSSKATTSKTASKTATAKAASSKTAKTEPKATVAKRESKTEVKPSGSRLTMRRSEEPRKSESQASTKSATSKSTVAKREPTKLKASSTKSTTTKSASNKAPTAKTTVAKTTAAKPKTATKTTTVAKKEPTRTKTSADRVRELEQENERLRKLLDSRKITSVKTVKAGSSSRTQNDSKKPSKKLVSDRR